MAHMLNGLGPTDGESRLVETTREHGLLNMLRKRRMGYLKEGFTHGVMTLVPPWWGDRLLMIVFTS